MKSNSFIKDTSGSAFPVIIGLACVFIGLGLYVLMDEVITPLQNIYVNTSYTIGYNTTINAPILYNATTDAYSAYMWQTWHILPFILMLVGVIFIMVNSQREQ